VYDVTETIQIEKDERVSGRVWSSELQTAAVRPE
jgi:hypothetical protein